MMNKFESAAGGNDELGRLNDTSREHLPHLAYTEQTHELEQSMTNDESDPHGENKGDEHEDSMPDLSTDVGPLSTDRTEVGPESIAEYDQRLAINQIGPYRIVEKLAEG